MSVVLLVENDPKLRAVVSANLQQAGFAVLATGSGAEAVLLSHSARPSLVILDLGLPDLAGGWVARELRSIATPFVLLSEHSSETDRVRGLEMGADDYITKPFSLRELVLRAQAVLRRRAAPSDGILERCSYGAQSVVIDESSRTVEVRGASVALTPTEWGLLLAVASVPRRVYSRLELINRVRGYEFDGFERTIDSHVKNLRRKIEKDPSEPKIVQTVLRVGYRFALSRDR
jgi:DNA-binding response OmpR family regulator